MKKQLFLLSLLSLFFGTTNVSVAKDCCEPKKCETKCADKCEKNCDVKCDDCGLVSGKTFRRNSEVTFTNGSPIYASFFNTNVVRNLDSEDQHGGLQVTVFGGKNTKRNQSAMYYFPYGHSTYTVDGTVDDQTHAAVFALSSVDVADLDGSASNSLNAGSSVLNNAPAVLATNIASDAATFKFDANKDTSILRPWNFGITHAALFEPRGASENGAASGTGLVTNPVFKSTICPTYHYSHVGAGFGLRYHFSDDKNGFWGSISTSVEHVRSHLKLNEEVLSARKDLTTENFPAQNLAVADQNIFGRDASPSLLTTSTGDAVLGLNGTPAVEAPLGSIQEAYINGENGTGFPIANAPENMEQAFEQEGWNYGKIGCEQSITRLANIELCLGYQWTCGDCASTSWYVGLDIPTGNKPCPNYVAPAVVGNGQHVGLMAGSTLNLLLSENEDRSIWYRMDTNGRYLFRNTQKRSFDLHGNEWSRYMMVWESKEAYSAAVAAVNALGEEEAIANNYRNYTPGINVFTQDMHVKPRTHARINQAVYFRSECMNAEFGWNVFARSKECAEFACDWDKNPAFADPSYLGGLNLNNHRTIYNDAQLMSVNAVDSFARKENAATPVTTLANSLLTDTLYEKFQITQSEANLDSATQDAVLSHTPYLALGYAWNSDCKPEISVGAQYEFSQGNRAINKWMVWGKFEFAF